MYIPLFSLASPTQNFKFCLYLSESNNTIMGSFKSMAQQGEEWFNVSRATNFASSKFFFNTLIGLPICIFREWEDFVSKRGEATTPKFPMRILVSLLLQMSTQKLQIPESALRHNRNLDDYWYIL